MYKQHLFGVFIIIMATLISFMTVARAEEFHWGFKPSRDGAEVEIG